MDSVTEKALEFKRRFPSTIAWRIKKHAKVVSKHLNPGEEIKYVFAGQKNDRFYDIMSTNVVVITNQRLLIGMKRVLFGYFYTSITPDLFNDFKIMSGIIWGKICIDTMGEFVVFTNISKNAMTEIETQITENIMKLKKEYGIKEARN